MRHELIPISWLALAVTILCSGGGNVIANWSHHFSGRWHLVVLCLACGVQVLGLVFFSVALTGIPLNIAYPILIGSSMVLVTITAALWFKESLSSRHFVGLALIIIGMLLIKSGATSHEIQALNSAGATVPMKSLSP